MKRYISLACVAIVVIMCMVSPVSAAEVNDFSLGLELLDYCTVNDSGSNFFTFSNNIDISFSLPTKYTANSIDMLIQCDGEPISSVYSNWWGTLTSLSFIQIDNSSYYRIYGVIPTDGYNFINLQFNSSSSSPSYVSILSCRVYNTSFRYDVDAYCQIVAADYDKTIHFIPTDEINYRIFESTDVYSDTYFFLYIYSDKWKSYDFLDFQLMLDVSSVTSINCVMGSQNVPFELSYIEPTPIEGNSYFVSIRVDLRDLDLNSEDHPMLTFMGRLDPGVLNSIDFVNCCGYVLPHEINPLFFYFSSLIDNLNLSFKSLENNISREFLDLKDWFVIKYGELHSWIVAQTDSFITVITTLRDSIDSRFADLYQWMDLFTANIILAIRGDTTPGDSFQNEVNQKDQQLNDMAAVMDSVNQPDLNTVNVSANTYVDSTVLAASMSGITSVFSQGLYLNLIVMSIMMATAGYVLFGKR